MINGLSHIANAFAQARSEKRAALMPYFTLGYPSLDQSVAIVKAISQAGADLIELGIPFSDPLADGRTIQASTQVALEQGASLEHCLEMTARLRKEGVCQPLLLMGYINPILAFGVNRFVQQATESGADGFIVPDLPPEEAGDMQAACQAKQSALVYLVSPTTPMERLNKVSMRSTGFLYLVSLTGVTGARKHLAAGLDEFIRRARGCTGLPLAVGFGISTPVQAKQVGELADGVIVGSALIDAVRQSADPCQAAYQFVHELRTALT